MKNNKRGAVFYVKKITSDRFLKYLNSCPITNPTVKNEGYYDFILALKKYGEKHDTDFIELDSVVHNEVIHRWYSYWRHFISDDILTHPFFTHIIIKTIYRHALFGDRMQPKEHWYSDFFTEFDIVDGVKCLKKGEIIFSTKMIKANTRQAFYIKLYNEKIKKKILQDIKEDTAALKKYLSSNKRLFTGAIRALALERANYKCEMCGKSSKESTLHVDHIKPYSMGGKTSLANARVLCCDCNIGVYHAKQKHTTGGIA